MNTTSVREDGVTLHGIRLGDRRRTARGWLAVAGGAVRAILSAGMDGEVLLGFACDRRVAPEGLLVFHDIEEARAWLEKRLPTEPRRARMARIGRTRPKVERIRPQTLAEAERALLTAATDYCWSIRHRPKPDDGPLRQLWDAANDCRRFTRTAKALGREHPHHPASS
jgi:hypothetical protein